MAEYVLAVDIGASSGRHMLGALENGKLVLTEVYRFPNGAAQQHGHLCWDLEALWGHILKGMKECKRLGKIPSSMGVDTWGVDFVLLDAQAKPLGDSIAYRDSRTKDVLDKISFEALYAHTGIAKQPFNTVYQLMATPKEQLDKAAHLLMVPDYFHFLLSGQMCNELTIASTGALVNAQTRSWDQEVLRMANIPPRLFQAPITMPGTCLGKLRPEVAREVGFDLDVILPASHDTGSAYMAVPAKDDRAVYLSSGTWSLLGVENEQPILSAPQSGFTNEGGYGGKVRFLRNIMGLWMLQCIRKELDNQYSFAQMADMAEAGKAYRATVDPMDDRFLAPQSMTAEIKAALKAAGKQPPKDVQELLACVNYSLAKCYADGILVLEALTGKTYTSLNIVGGGCQNKVLNQWTADATGLTVFAGPSEATALGNVVAQLIAQGKIQDVQAAREKISRDFAVQTYTPNKGET